METREPLAEFRVIGVGTFDCKIGSPAPSATPARTNAGFWCFMSGSFNDSRGGPSPAGESWNSWSQDEDEGPEVSPLVVDAVGRALQFHFQAIADLPLPDRFMVLLAELEARERSS